MKRALIIAAHPDDEVLGCGGIISKYASIGVEFAVLFVGEGSSCRYLENEVSEISVAIKKREDSARNAMQYLGVSSTEFYDFPCGKFDQVPIIEINRLIESAIKRFSPDTVFTHSQYDANNDHRLVYSASIMATRPLAENRVLRLFSYEVLSSSEWAFTSSFSPNYFEELSEADVTRKIGALNYYDTELRDFPFPRSERGLRNLAQNRGMQAGTSNAEAFFLIREFRT